MDDNDLEAGNPIDFKLIQFYGRIDFVCQSTLLIVVVNIVQYW